MLAEIALLSRQNELIKAQLSRAKELRSACEGSPEGVGGQRRSCSSDTGRVTPQSIEERKLSDAESLKSNSQHVQAAEGDQRARQVNSLTLPSHNCAKETHALSVNIEERGTFSQEAEEDWQFHFYRFVLMHLLTTRMRQ